MNLCTTIALSRYRSDECINGMSVSNVNAKITWIPGLIQALAASQSR